MIGALLSPLVTPTRALSTATPARPTVTPHSATLIPTQPVPTHMPSLVFWPFGFHSTAANWDAFGITLWSTAFATLAVGIFIAVVAGLILYRIQQSNEQRGFTRRCARELAQFKERLIEILMIPPPFDTNQITERALDLNVEGVTMVLREHYPLSEWEKTLPNEKAFFQALHLCRRRYMEFLAAASPWGILVEATMSVVVDRILSDQSTLASQARAVTMQINLLQRLVRAYCLLRAMDWDEATLFRWRVLEGEYLKAARAAYRLIERDRRDVLLTYQSARREATAAATALREMLMPPQATASPHPRRRR